MRRTVLFVLMISFLLLSACGGAEKDALNAQRENWCAAERLCFTVELSADMARDEVFTCTLDCEKNAEGLDMCIAAPDIIAGITVHQTAGETLLRYDGLEVAVGDLDGTQIAPAEAVPLLLEALLRGHLTELYEEKNEENTIICAQMYVDEGIYAIFRFDEHLTPLQGELVSGGHAVATMDFQSFTSEQGVSDNETPDHENLG